LLRSAGPFFLEASLAISDAALRTGNIEIVQDQLPLSSVLVSGIGFGLHTYANAAPQNGR
jgi:hypothetical protein